MTRVTENSSQASISYALNRTKKRLEDLQLKGSTLKAISKPSDNPISNVESLKLKSTKSDNGQFQKNIGRATMVLNSLEQTLERIEESYIVWLGSRDISFITGTHCRAVREVHTSIK